MEAVHGVARRIGVPVGSPPRRAGDDGAVQDGLSRLGPLYVQLGGGSDDSRMATVVGETVWNVSLIRAHALSVDLPVYAPRSEAPPPMNPSAPGGASGTVDYTTTGTAFVQGPGQPASGIDPNDITQRGLGDCGLMSSLAAVARTHPNLIHDMITDNGDGSYNVRLRNVAGAWFWAHDRVYNVRAVFPANAGGPSPFGAQPGDTNAAGKVELWPLLIEKAWAAEKGGYGNIVGTLPKDCIAFMTGKSVDTTQCSSKGPGDLLTLLRDADTAGKPTVVWTSNRLHTPNPFNILQPHAYTFMGIVDGKINLRNPHGFNHAYGMPPTEVQSQFYEVDIGDV
jgi:hypothetical protein